MKRLMTLCIMLSAIALIASPAFAEVQNVKVSGDVNSAGTYRESFDLLDGSQTANGDQENSNKLMTNARVRVDADLTDNVSTTVRLLAEYDWDTNANTSGNMDNVDIDLANVTLKEMFFAPLTVTVGRQELRYGNAFILGDPDTNATSADVDLTAGDLSLRKSFDAVKAVIDYDPLVVDVIFAKISDDAAILGAGAPAYDADNDDETLYGINAAYDIGNYDSEIEAYWFLKRDDNESDPIRTLADSTSPGQEIYTYGLRGSVVPIENLNVLGEIAWQTGDFDKCIATGFRNAQRDQDAMAYQVGADYTFGDVTIPWVEVTIGTPMIKAGFTHYDGEEVGNTGDQNAWIPLFEDQTHGVVANYILGGINGGQNSNADILNLGFSIVPLEDLTLSIDFYNFWLDEKLAEEASASLATNRAGDVTALDWTNLTEASYFGMVDDELGYEIDVALNYDYTEDVKMGLLAGWFNPGDALDGASTGSSNSETAIEVLATLDVAF